MTKLHNRLSGMIALLALVVFVPTIPTHAEEFSRRHLVVAGGGALPAVVWTTFIELAGGTNKTFLAVPQASNRETAGESIANKLREFGATRVGILDLTQPDKARELIRNADAIWFGGGQQSLLMQRLRDANVTAAIRSRMQDGIVFGGSSAGAAVQSDLMIAGDKLPVLRGLALWPEVVVDQHFVARKRFNRSLATIMNHPDKLGIGIDEGTAAIVSSDSFKVLGTSSITVIDARQARQTENASGSTNSWRDVRVHWLQPGESFKFTKSP
jgi:cyanophycinase